MSLENLVNSVRKTINKPQGFKVFFASGLNMTDVKTALRNSTEAERAVVLQLFNESFSESIQDLKEADHEKLISLYNALYETTSNVSHFANCYLSDVFCIMHDSEISENDIKIVGANYNNGSSVNDSSNVSVQLPPHVNRDTNMIPHGTLWGKNRKHGIYGHPSRNSYSPIEFLTMLAVTGEGQVKVFVRNFAVMANYSYILTAEGKLVRQKYGVHDKFIDVDGKNHRPILNK